MSRGLWKKYGDKRVIDTPISEVRHSTFTHVLYIRLSQVFESLVSDLALSHVETQLINVVSVSLMQMGFAGIAVGAAMVSSCSST